MRRLTLLVFIAVMALVVAACDSLPTAGVDGTSTVVGEASEAITDAMLTAEPADQTAAPGEIVVEPALTAEPPAVGEAIVQTADGSAAATLMTGDLPVVANIQVIPATAYDNSQPPSPIGLPEHIRVDFTVEGRTDPTAANPVLYIIPTADYAALWEGAGDMGVSGTLAGLQALINERFEPFPSAGIPVLPVERVGAAFNDLSIQGKYLELDGVSGLRFVGRFVQEPVPVTNEGLTYVFLGFTDDKQYFVSFLYPIQTAQLPANLDAADPTELELFSADIDAYYAERVGMLNSLTEADWLPSLTTLDSVLASMRIGEPAQDDVVAVAGSPLTVQPWQWLRTVGPAGETVASDPARYVVSFNPDGTAAIQADCNTVLATYTAADDGAITILLGPSTLAACPPESQDQTFLSALAGARFYFLEDGGLSIEVAEDGTTMQFMGAGDLAQGLAPETIAPESAATESAGGDFLIAGLWQWTSTDDPMGNVPTDNPAQYSIAFNLDGTASIQADCNRVIAAYTTTEDGAISIQPGPSTLAACGPDSRDTEFIQSLAAVVRYSGQGDTLALEMMADGGVMNFALADEMAAVVPEGDLGDTALIGPIWQWTILRQLNGETAIPEPSLYTITFNSDGTAALRADCGVAGATYTAGPDGSLTIAPGPSTAAQPCGPNSLDQVFLGGLGAAQSYVVDGGALAITLQLENGTMVFVPTNN